MTSNQEIMAVLERIEEKIDGVEELRARVDAVESFQGDCVFGQLSTRYVAKIVGGGSIGAGTIAGIFIYLIQYIL